MTRLWLLLLLLLPWQAFAQPVGSPAPLHYASVEEEARFHALTAELRCVQCQNQSLADSNAQIAQDLRREVLALMHEGRSDAQIRQFLVARYGEFVLYRPRVESRTWLLWFGPLLVFLLGVGAVVLVVRKHSTSTSAPALPTDEQEW